MTAFLIKMWLNLTTFGTNDVTSWWRFSKYIIENDSFNIYKDILRYNHPPLISAWLWLIGVVIEPSKTQFAYIFRMPAILADIGSVIIVWKLLMMHVNRRKACALSCIFALSPVLMMVSGFHGNTDPVFMFLILLSLHQILIRRDWLGSAIVLGLALNIKIVPVIMLPALIFWIRTWRIRCGYVLVTLSLVAVGYGYHLYTVPEAMVRNVFMYSSLKGLWGIGKFYSEYNYVGKFMLLITITLASWFIGRAACRTPDRVVRDRYLLDAFCVTFLCFFVFTPGFGIQYLSWMVAPTVFLGIWVSMLFNTVGMVFLFRVYTFWSGGFPWYYANSWGKGRWRDLTTTTLDTVLWLFLMLVLIAVMVKIMSKGLGEKTIAQSQAKQ